MDKIKVAIVEDEFLISHDISNNLKELGYEISGIYESGAEAIAGIRREPPDILLMDINIKGDIDGIDTAGIVRDSWNMPIIYVTAYTDKTTLNRAKKTLPHAFIIKPFNFKSLSTTIEFAIYNYTNNLVVNLNETRKLPKINEEEHINSNVIFLKEKGRLVKILTSEFYYLSAKGSYCEIITANKKFTVSRNLQSLMGKLSSDTFIRIHRSYAVNINMIDAIYESEILIYNERIPISKASRNELLNRVNSI